MAFVANATQQLTLMDSTFNLTEREKRFLEKSWAKTFADKVFPAIDENIFSGISGRSYIDNGKLHLGCKYVLALDISKFFRRWFI